MLGWKERVRRYKIALLTDWLDQCNESQRELFYRFYPNTLETIKSENLDTALSLVERTLRANSLTRPETF